MFYTIIIKEDSHVIYAYNTQEGAMDKFHSEMAYAYNQHIPTSAYVTDKYFSKLKKDIYEPTVVE